MSNRSSPSLSPSRHDGSPEPSGDDQNVAGSSPPAVTAPATITFMTPMTPEDIESAISLFEIDHSGNSVTSSSSEGDTTWEEFLSDGSSAPQSPAESSLKDGFESPRKSPIQSRSKSPSRSRSKSCSSSRSKSRLESKDSDDSATSDQTQWNIIIPEASRTVPVGNNPAQRPGRGRQALTTPALPSRVSVNQRGWRLRAMRQLLGEPVGIADDDLREALMSSGWDLGTALRGMNTILNQARDRHRANEPNRSLAEQQRDRLLGADSLHHNRRLGIDFLYTRLIQVVPQHQHHMLTTLTLGQLLADHRFDIDEAINAFLERLIHPGEIEQHQRIERRLRLINPNQLHLDQRVARFMEIAGTDDYFAARGLLDHHGGDLHRAMDHWMRNGLAPRPIPIGQLNRSLFRTPRRPHTDIADLWPHPRPLAGQLNNVDADDIADAQLNYGQGPYVNREGWFVRYPREEARIGINIPSRLRNDYIRNDEFTVVQVHDVERPDGSGIRDPFDYNNSEHIKHLNNQASQWFRRTLGGKTKERGAFYQNDENEWIWWWHNERHWELIEEHPELLDATTAADWQAVGARWPMRIDPQQLTRDFNNHWAPQTQPPDPNSRQPRDTRSLDAQRRRIPELCDDFGLPFSPPHKPRDKKRKKSKYSSSGSEGDEDESDDDNDDGRPKTPAKKPKSTSTPKKSAQKGKGKSKAETMSDVEAEGSGEEKSPDAQPAKKSPPSAKKGGSGKGKRKRDQNEDDDNKYHGPSSTPSGKRGGGVRRSKRKWSKD